MTHHPHIHGIVPVRVLSRLVGRLLCEWLEVLHASCALQFFGRNAHLTDPAAFAARVRQKRRRGRGVYAKRPFAGPEQVLAYLARYTHRIAISNQRITAFDGQRVRSVSRINARPNRIDMVS